MGKLRDVLLDTDISFKVGFQSALTEATPERVERLVQAFEDDNEAMFVVVRQVFTTTPLIVGEVGSATLLLDNTPHGIPCVQYRTKSGSVTLYPHEVMPASQELINSLIEDGYEYIESGKRLIPPLEIAQEVAELCARHTNNQAVIDITSHWRAVRGDNTLSAG